MLDKQKVTPMTAEGLAAVIQEGIVSALPIIAMAIAPMALQAKGPCFGCGQYSHIKAQCRAGGGRCDEQGNG